MRDVYDIRQDGCVVEQGTCAAGIDSVRQGAWVTVATVVQLPLKGHLTAQMCYCDRPCDAWLWLVTASCMFG